jgi:alpha-N-arabinofuranosidase
VLTPTYYAFKMYKVHQDANLLPINISCENYTVGNESIKSISSSASVDRNGLTHITLTNVNPNKEAKVKIELAGSGQKEFVRGEIITAKKINSYNDFGKDEEVTLKGFDNVKITGNSVQVELPAKSIVMLELK